MNLFLGTLFNSVALRLDNAIERVKSTYPMCLFIILVPKKRIAYTLYYKFQSFGVNKLNDYKKIIIDALSKT